MDADVDSVSNGKILHVHHSSYMYMMYKKGYRYMMYKKGIKRVLASVQLQGTPISGDLDRDPWE